jgi:uncharacterized protein YdiU (UPF0061 family)
MPDIAFDNSYARLPERFFARANPEPASAPRLIAWNDALAATLGLPAMDDSQRAALFSGAEVPHGADPLAMAYAGHQFGGFVPQLGDGRAMLLGEVMSSDGTRMDIQLKGSGRTAFSRGGDGRAWLGPVLREFLVSEAMAALSIPTTRALAAVATGDPVYREGAMPGAVLTRVAASHIRVGTFQYFAARKDTDALQILTDYTLTRHYPDALGAEGLLRAAVTAQANLVAHWMAVGFVHGVMNTDNAHVGGLTIDYGPCAFLDSFNPDAVFSSIDRQGRYAYSNQPHLATWNLAQLASSLLPLLGDGTDEDAAIAQAIEIVNGFTPQFDDAYQAQFRAKIGLTTAQEGDAELIDDLLRRMALLHVDFTQAFNAMGHGNARDFFIDPAAFDQWHATWRQRLLRENSTEDAAMARMRQANPALIPRNHQIEAVITEAVSGDFSRFHRLHQALATPFDLPASFAEFQAAPDLSERVTATFCGT